MEQKGQTLDKRVDVLRDQEVIPNFDPGEQMSKSGIEIYTRNAS